MILKATLKELGIKHKKSFVAYPQGNGQLEITNRTILRGQEKRLENCKKNWPDELPKVLWAFWTSTRTSIKESPFKLAYGTEARLAVEVGSPSHRVIYFEEVSNVEGLKINLELLDEVRDQAIHEMEEYKEKNQILLWQKAKVKEYAVGDSVLRDIEASDPTNTGNLEPNREGPYKNEGDNLP